MDTSEPLENPTVPVRHAREGELHILSQEHETVLYHGDDVVAKPKKEVEEEDEDDSFFEVTINDVKSMFSNLQQRRDNLENAPLLGQKYRELEKDKAILKRLHDHPNTAVRIRFPDRFVLQGIFRTSDTIGSVKSWLRESLADSALEFYLFTAPPKKVLNDDMKLVDEGLVAMVVLYIGAESMPENNRVLKQDIYSRVSDPEKSFELAKEKLKVRQSEEDNDHEIKPSTETQLKDHASSNGPQQQPVRRPVDKGKVPKWFKMK
ncbi:Tether containing UBX domain for GLUT4 [Orchesella cincta]|uniref:Tether containing UBX domain for GLUT4 n=1 Tax=Orchesella cincta TaxID=48709 RepID=A0A1D2NHA8_ORCCI|nr:Tether containing UBX domain for GLUT4 [Orchesella cincta]